MNFDWLLFSLKGKQSFDESTKKFKTKNRTASVNFKIQQQVLSFRIKVMFAEKLISLPCLQ
jgi:hypothetical protein